MQHAETTPMRNFRYNPSWQKPEELKNLFVARRPLFERLYAQISGQGTSGVPRHHLIIGQRGMGKTTLLRRLALELKEKNPDFLPLTFWEEQYVEVDRLSVFWLNCLDSLADALEMAAENDFAEQIDQQVRKIESIAAEEERAREAAKALEDAVRQSGRRLVLFIDNFNLLISRLKSHDHVLRGFFTRHAAPIIIGAGITPPDDIADYDAAFYDGFQTTLLHRLSLMETQEMIRRLAEEHDELDAINAMWRELPRVSALRDLSGGNPRTCLLIYQLCSRGFSESIYRDLEILLDETTPLFQSRFEQLSDQGQKLVARLARHWAAATAEDITEFTNFPRGTVSPLLGRLEEEGIIEKVPLYDARRRDEPKAKRGGLSKKVGYQIAERFFSIWLIMRSSSRRERDGVRCLSRWLECLYSREELEVHTRRFSSQSVLGWDQAVIGRALVECMAGPDGGDTHDLRLASEITLLSFAKRGQGELEGIMDEKSFDDRARDFVVLRDLLEKRVGRDAKTPPKEFADLVLGSPSILIETGLSRSIIAALDNRAPLAVDRLAGMLREEHLEFSEKVGEEAQSWLSSRLSQGLLHWRGDLESLEAAFEKAPNSRAKACIGALAQRGGHLPLAEKAYHAALSQGEPIYYAWEGLAQIYHKATRHSEAREAYAKALALDESSAAMCSNYGQLLAITFHQLAEAEPWFRKAAKLDPRDSSIANNLGCCLWFQGGKEKAEEAIREFQRAAALNLSHADPKLFINIGNIYQNELKDFAKAQMNYERAVSMTTKAPLARTYLADLLQHHLRSYTEAERQYRKAIEDGSEDSYTWLGLGNLLTRHLGRHLEAAEAFEEAIRIKPELEAAWHELAIVKQVHLGQPQEAKAALLQVLEINPKNAEALNSLGNLEYDTLRDFTSAQKHLQEAVVANPEADHARYNLIFLLRDTLGDMAAARSLFVEKRRPELWKDTQALHRALFACYDDNWGLAAAALDEALQTIEKGAFPKNTQDDWCRSSAVMLKLGFGAKLLQFLEAQNCKTKMLPWYAALDAHLVGDKQLLLNYPAEARPSAELLFDQIASRTKIVCRHLDEQF